MPETAKRSLSVGTSMGLLGLLGLLVLGSCGGETLSTPEPDPQTQAVDQERESDGTTESNTVETTVSVAPEYEPEPKPEPRAEPEPELPTWPPVELLEPPESLDPLEPFEGPIPFGASCPAECPEVECYVPGTGDNPICSQRCEEPDDCGAGAVCQSVGGTARWCFRECRTGADCGGLAPSETNPLFCAESRDAYDVYLGESNDEVLQMLCIQESEP